MFMIRWVKIPKSALEYSKAPRATAMGDSGQLMGPEWKQVIPASFFSTFHNTGEHGMAFFKVLYQIMRVAITKK